jgi:hypothetical protein
VRFEKRRHPRDERTRTLICVPVYKDNITGVAHYESEEKLAVNRRAKNEIVAISNAIALLERKAARNTQDHDVTLNAIDRLERLAEPEDFFGEAPLLFFGYSEKADQAVVDQIRQTVATLEVSLIDWETKAEPGDVRSTLYKDLMQVRAGILYLSEKNNVNHNEEMYKDNANVIFEAGMLQTRFLEEQRPTMRHRSAMPFLGWIGIREQSPSGLPFDIAGERILYVKRLASHKVASEEFGDKLRQRLDSLLGSYRKDR